jgi:hypothetical protein
VRLRRAFVERWPGRKLSDVRTIVVGNDVEEYGIDIDRAGTPLGVELLHRSCLDG